MYNTRINEFEPDQINLLLEVIEERLNAIQIAQMKAELNEEEDMTAIINKCEEDLKTLTLWRVQLLNAKEDIKQLVNSN